MQVCFQAPVVFELSRGPDGKMGGLVVRARNKYTFLSTAGLLLAWRILLDGVPLMVGDPAQGDAAGWYPGGSVPLAPQVCCAHLDWESAELHAFSSWAMQETGQDESLHKQQHVSSDCVQTASAKEL